MGEGDLAQMDPAELEKKFGHLKKDASTPELTPEQQKLVIRAYKNLSPDKRKTVDQIVRHSCGDCERELGMKNVGVGHGICERHKAMMYKQMGRPAPTPNPNNATLDLKTVDPELLKISAYITSLMLRKQRRDWKKEPALAAA